MGAKRLNPHTLSKPASGKQRHPTSNRTIDRNRSSIHSYINTDEYQYANADQNGYAHSGKHTNAKPHSNSVTYFHARLDTLSLSTPQNEFQISIFSSYTDWCHDRILRITSAGTGATAAVYIDHIRAKFDANTDTLPAIIGNRNSPAIVFIYIKQFGERIIPYGDTFPDSNGSSRTDGDSRFRPAFSKPSCPPGASSQSRIPSTSYRQRNDKFSLDRFR